MFCSPKKLSYEQDVAAGLHDEQIENLVKSLRVYGRPVFLRIGYEFNGQWNGYEPEESFVSAWRRIVDAVRAAAEQGKTVMIGVSTSRRVGVRDGAESWERWYAPYFELIRSQPGIKAFCYINRNWASFSMWSDWGDCRIEENPVVLERFHAEMSSPFYKHAVLS